MIFRQLFDPNSSTYTYLLADPVTRDAIMIDSVFEQHARDAALVRELDLKLRLCVDTHVHADHVTGAWLLKEATGCAIAIAETAGAQGVDRPLRAGDTLEAGGVALEVRATPGHTAGCSTLVLADGSMAFTGDALLIRGAGRTDFQQGDAAQLYRSVREQILSLPPECVLYPGHDYNGRTSTTVAEERAHNPRLNDSVSEAFFVEYMESLGLPHPKRMADAVPANLRSGRPLEAAKGVTWAPVIRTYAGVLQIEPEWVHENPADLFVLDVRTPAEVEGAELGAIAGSKPIPLADLRDRLAEVPQDRPIITVCTVGSRSSQAALILEKAGYTRVANLAGGLVRWRSLGFPIN